MLEVLATSNVTKRYDFSSLRAVRIGGAVVPTDLLRRLYGYGQQWMSRLYGMTASAPYVAWNCIREAVPAGVLKKVLPMVAYVLREGVTVKCAHKGRPNKLRIPGPNLMLEKICVQTNQGQAASTMQSHGTIPEMSDGSSREISMCGKAGNRLHRLSGGCRSVEPDPKVARCVDLEPTSRSRFEPRCQPYKIRFMLMQGDGAVYICRRA